LILVDTDHATLLKYPDSERGRRFIERLSAVPESEVIGVAIVTVEERMRGWLAVIAKEKTALVHNALLLSANQRDFGRVPGLRVENWLDETTE